MARQNYKSVTSKKTSLILFTLMFVFFISLFFLHKAEKKDSVQKFLTARVLRKDITQTIQALGTLQAREQVDVGAQVTGQVINLLVDEGQYVRKGELLAEIDPAVAQNKLKKSEAALAQARADLRTKKAILQQAKQALNRQRQMLHDGGTSLSDLEQAEVKVTVSEADEFNAAIIIKGAEIEVETAKTELGYTRIVSPMDGTVLSILTKQGQTLNASQVVPTLLKLADLSVMTVKVQISEADVIHLKEGMPVFFTLIGEPHIKYSAHIGKVQVAPININENNATNNAVYYYATFDIANVNGKLRVAMTAQVSIVLDKKENTLVIPVSSLGKFIRDDLYEVNVISSDRSEVRIIKTGMRNQLFIEVIEGLEEGEKVLLGSGKEIETKEHGGDL